MILRYIRVTVSSWKQWGKGNGKSKFLCLNNSMTLFLKALLGPPILAKFQPIFSELIIPLENEYLKWSIIYWVLDQWEREVWDMFDVSSINHPKIKYETNFFFFFLSSPTNLFFNVFFFTKQYKKIFKYNFFFKLYMFL